MISRMGDQANGQTMFSSRSSFFLQAGSYDTASPSRAEVLLRLRRQPDFSPRHLGVQLPAAVGSVCRSHLCLDRRIPLPGEFSIQLILDSLDCSGRDGAHYFLVRCLFR